MTLSIHGSGRCDTLPPLATATVVILQQVGGHVVWPQGRHIVSILAELLFGWAELRYRWMKLRDGGWAELRAGGRSFRVGGASPGRIWIISVERKPAINAIPAAWRPPTTHDIDSPQNNCQFSSLAWRKTSNIIHTIHHLQNINFIHLQFHHVYY